jgi:hypothetical protein
VARSDDIEQILAAWYRLKTAQKHKAIAAASLNRLLDDARAGTNLSRQELVEAHASMSITNKRYAKKISSDESRRAID